MKKLLLSFIILFSTIISFCQTLDILANQGTSQVAALGSMGNYHVTESIYTNAEIGNANFTTSGTAINKVGFYASTLGTATNFANVKIYMMEVPAGTTTLATGDRKSVV